MTTPVSEGVSVRFKVWVEVMTTQRWTEDVVEVPDEQWDAMSDAEREEYKKHVYLDMQTDVASGGWEEIED